jgi:uncharacterized membrane protein YdjX (TVP38/TMEM64 family)
MIDAESMEGVLMEEREPDAAGKLRQQMLRIAGLILAVAITITVYLLRDRLQDVAGYGYLGLFFISILGYATIILPVPTLLAAYLGGGVLNPVLVGVISAAGASIGELTGYLAGYGGQAIVENRKLYERFQGWMQRYGLFALFFLAAVPNPFFDVAGIIAGMTRIKVWTFLLVVWAGNIIKFMLFAYLGAGSVELLDWILGR